MSRVLINIRSLTVGGGEFDEMATFYHGKAASDFPFGPMSLARRIYVRNLFFDQKQIYLLRTERLKYLFVV